MAAESPEGPAPTMSMSRTAIQRLYKSAAATTRRRGQAQPAPFQLPDCPLAAGIGPLAETPADQAVSPLCFTSISQSRIQERRMHAPIKYIEKGIAVAANGAWQVFSRL